MFEIYNLVSIIQSDKPEPGNIRDRIGLLNSDVQGLKDAFMSKRTYEDASRNMTTPSKRRRASHGGQGGITGNGMRRDEHVYDDPQVVSAFARSGYTLEPYTFESCTSESDDDDMARWVPANKVKQPRTLFVGLIDEVHAAEAHNATRHTIRRHRRCREAAPLRL